MRSILFALALLALAPPARAQTAAPFDGAAWREDLALLARELPARHPGLFYRLSRARWDSVVSAIDRRLPTMSRNEALVALMEVAALPNDGHTSIHPLFDPAFDVRYYPFELHLFDDGLFVRSAAPNHASLAGARVVRIGRVSAEEALAAVARTVSHENEWWLRTWAPGRLEIPEILDGLGLVDDMERLPLEVERVGRRETVTVSPAGRLVPKGHDPRGPIDRTGWVDMRGPGEPPLWLRHPGRPYWVEYVAPERMLYVAYRGVVSVGSPTNQEFWRHVFALADSLPVERLVLDLRENSGGESAFNRQVVRGIVARPALDHADRLFVITGGRTFSAAMNLALDLESWTNATFVGEPTGNATMFFGDHRPVVLPASGFTVNVSSLAWHPDDPRDVRPFIAPDVYVPLASGDYRTNVDPVLAAILARGTEPSLAERVEAAVARGDTTAAAALVETARTQVANRFRPPEAEVNALGYRLLNEDRAADAVAVFRINARVFPESANVWDSLGEGLLTAGRRDEGVAAYRRALAIDPEFASALEALARLEGRADPHP